MTDEALMEQSAKFHTMTEGTQEDWDIIMTHMQPFARNGGARVLDHLRLLAFLQRGPAIAAWFPAGFAEPAIPIEEDAKFCRFCDHAKPFAECHCKVQAPPLSGPG